MDQPSDRALGGKVEVNEELGEGEGSVQLGGQLSSASDALVGEA